MTALVIRGDAARLPLPDNSVDLIVSSPPYWSLRSYQDGGEHYPGQVGSEDTPEQFIDALLDCTREWARVLKPSGSMFINLGDKYATAGTRQGQTGVREFLAASKHYGGRPAGFRDKSLMLLPERYRIGCVDRLGLIARAVIVWDKPNGLPESVTDRVRRSHEDWVHLTLQPRYYSSVDEIREPHAEVSIKRAMPHRAQPGRRGPEVYGDIASPQTLNRDQMNNPLGKLPGSVWNIPSEPLDTPDYLVEQDGRLVQWIENDRAAWEWMRRTGVDRSPLSRGTGRMLIVAPDHFAAYPSEWPRRIISGWSPAGICTACGEGRRPVSEYVDGRESAWARMKRDGHNGYADGGHGLNHKGHHPSTARGRMVTGFTCSCDSGGYRSTQGLPLPPTRLAVVLDPFGGTGTTALCASVLGRIGITVDLSADYGRLALWRTQDAGQRARAARAPKPRRQQQTAGQDALWD